MDLIRQRYLIKYPLNKVWDALTDPKVIEKWGAGPAKMSDEVGFKFSLWGGDIYGTNIEVKKPEKGSAKLVQEWYGGEWEIPSIVTFSLNSTDGLTEVILEHKDLPKDQIEEFAQGWKDYYLGSIKKLLEI